MVAGDAVEEGNAERQLTEVEALSAIFPDAVVPVTRQVETAVHDGCNAAEPSLLEVRVIIAPDPLDDAPVELIFLLPTGYPSDSPPVLTGVACSEFSRAESGKLQTALDQFLTQAYRDSPYGAGQECLYDAVLVAQECVASMRSSGLNEIGSAWVETDDANDVENTSGQKAHCCLLRIDHMNNPHKYTRCLQKWAAQLGIAGHVLMRAVNGRAKDVAVLLSGDCAEELSSFVSRLRTEYVDVNSKGHKCKERMAQVLCTFQTPSTLACSQPAGLVVQTYSAEEELHNILRELHVLQKWLDST